MQVGVNYPWFNYGWDFGLGPPKWRGSQTTPRWLAAIDNDLQLFRNLGISVVRWFILGDGLVYGSAGSAPYPDGANPRQWRFDPPALTAEVTADFEQLLQRFENANQASPRPIQLLPVFIDFHFAYPYDSEHPVTKADPQNPGQEIPDSDWIKQARSDALTDPVNQRFLDQALDPLLRVAQVHADVIYAWELINEPEWITNTWNPDGENNHPVDARSMEAFLDEGKTQVRAAGLKPTIGFASIDTLRRAGITAEINQFHHYPGGRTELQPNQFDPQYPGIVGEFATSPNDIWPELENDGQSVLNRLRQAEALGYPLAIPWSYRAQDDRTSWEANVERDIECFTQGRNCP